MKVIVEQVRESYMGGYFVIKVDQSNSTGLSAVRTFAYSLENEDQVKQQVIEQAKIIKSHGPYIQRETILEL